MTYEELNQRKEDSIRESTNNPKTFEHNGKTYKTFSEFLNSDDYKEFLEMELKGIQEYKEKAEEYFKSLEMDHQLLVFFHVTNVIYENYFEDSGSYRGLLYSKFKFGPEAYALGMDSGMFALHNSISTPKDNEERFNKLMGFLNLDLSKQQLASARNYFEYGFDASKHLDDVISGQQSLNFSDSD